MKTRQSLNLAKEMVSRFDIEAAVDPAVSFLTENSHFRSSQLFSALAESLYTAVEARDAEAFFYVPIREKILSFEKALLWANFVAHSAPLGEAIPGNGNPLINLNATFTALNGIYDVDFETHISGHWIEEETE